MSKSPRQVRRTNKRPSGGALSEPTSYRLGYIVGCALIVGSTALCQVGLLQRESPWMYLEWNWSRLRKLMKLSPGPVSVHPSHVSCSTEQSSVAGCEAKPSVVEKRKSIALPGIASPGIWFRSPATPFLQTATHLLPCCRSKDRRTLATQFLATSFRRTVVVSPLALHPALIRCHAKAALWLPASTPPARPKSTTGCVFRHRQCARRAAGSASSTNLGQSWTRA